MQAITKIIHVLAMGFWFGMALFFTFFVALTLFNEMEKQATNPREPWFPVWKYHSDNSGVIDGHKEQGSQAAGAMISPLFDWYFLLQGICGFLAVATAWSWQRVAGAIHRWRVTLLLLAITTVIIGWPIEQKVSTLRRDRNNKSLAYLMGKRTGQPSAREGGQLEKQALAAREEFGTWHMYSLFLNFGTIGLVTVVMGMAAFLPQQTATKNQTPSTPKVEDRLQVTADRT